MTAPNGTIVLIHGLFLNSSSWDGWIERFSARGFRVLAPGWPGVDGTVAQLLAYRGLASAAVGIDATAPAGVLVPPEYTADNFRLIDQSPATTGFKEFPGRPHFTGHVAGWEAVADFALDWALAPTP
jgi:hypothetical protein